CGIYIVGHFNIRHSVHNVLSSSSAVLSGITLRLLSQTIVKLSRSEVDLCGELDFTRSSLKQKWLAGAGDRASSRVADLSIWIIKLRSIKNIESLGAKLKTPTATL